MSGNTRPLGASRCLFPVSIYFLHLNIMCFMKLIQHHFAVYWVWKYNFGKRMSYISENESCKAAGASSERTSRHWRYGDMHPNTGRILEATPASSNADNDSEAHRKEYGAAEEQEACKCATENSRFTSQEITSSHNPRM